MLYILQHHLLVLHYELFTRLQITSLIKFKYKHKIFQKVFKIEKKEFNLLFIKFIFSLDNRKKIAIGEINLESELSRKMQYFDWFVIY